MVFARVIETGAMMSGFMLFITGGGDFSKFSLFLFGFSICRCAVDVHILSV
jgi:hypothetical protein